MATDPVDENSSLISSIDFEIPYPKKPMQCITSTPLASPFSPSPTVPFIFTHGAMGSLTSNAVVNFRIGFATKSPITCFQGNSNLVSRVKMFNVVIDAQKEEEAPKAIGGRSMGARAAVMAAKDREEVEYLVLVSYPLQNPSGEDVRDRILLEIGSAVKVLFVGGDRDELCDLEMLEGVRRKMKARSWRVVVKGADHGLSLKPKKATKGVGELIGEVAADWIENSNAANMEGVISWNGEEEAAIWDGWGNEVSEKVGKAGTATEKRKSKPSKLKETRVDDKRNNKIGATVEKRSSKASKVEDGNPSCQRRSKRIREKK